MDNKSAVDKILEGEPIQKILEKPGLMEAMSYDKTWEKQVWDAAKKVFGDSKTLWDIMAFAPDKYETKELQDALNAFSAWYQKFLKIKED